MQPPFRCFGLFASSRTAFGIAFASLVVASSLAPVGASEKVPAGLGASDWTSIRAAYDANRHTVFAVGAGYQAHNPGQSWLTSFDGRGVLTRPVAGGWTWGLELQSYGFGGDEREVCEPLRVSAEGQRVAYDWDATLREWWINGAHGLEHGYTLRERPTQTTAGALTLTLALRGDLLACVNADGRGVSFANASGARVLDYSGLVVLDADGRELHASFELDVAGLELHIDEADARYPLTIDPLAQQAYLKASNCGASDQFGYMVSVSGDTVAVGAFNESGGAAGVNGNQADNSLPSAGAVYVFVRTGTTWTQQAYIKASNPGAGDTFGQSLSLSGDTLVVGSYWEDSNATGVNGNQASNSAVDSGAAYVFVRNGTSWSQQAYLKASNANAGDRFASVAVSGDTVVVGATFEASSATGVNGNQADNSSHSSGAAYVFVRTGTTWNQEAYLKASNAASTDYFGGSVAASGDIVVIGASQEDSNATGVNGNQADNSAGDAGAAYVFVRNGTTWTQEAYLKASNAEGLDEFGVTVAVSGNTVLVGADHESSSAIGVNGNESDNSAHDAGAVYVFVRNGTSWTQEAYLKASNTEVADRFGASIAVSGNTAVVGAWGEASGTTGVNGNETDNSAAFAGAAYVFVRSGATWSQHAYLKAANTDAGDFFATGVSVSGDTVVVGAANESSSAVGVNGNQADNSVPGSGAAYVFSVQPDAIVYCVGDGTGTVCPCGNNGAAGLGCANSSSANGALLAATGFALVSSDSLHLVASDLPSSAPGLFFQSTSLLGAGNGVGFGDGLLCGTGTLIRLGVVFAAAGIAVYPTSLDPAVSVQGLVPAAGAVRYYQSWYRDAAVFCTPATYNVTNALGIAWSP